MKNRDDLQAEKNCEYQISPNRKKLWVIELDLLEMLEEACNNLNISYFMVFGSAIGAVRHQGFIPWDDDIDLGMLRDDFEIFLRNGKSYFPDYVDIQYGVSDRGPDILLRIRDGRTTGILNGERGFKGNKGAFIEIYVYDYVSSGIRANLQMKASSFLCGAMYANAAGFKGKVQRAIRKTVGLNTLWKTYDKVCKAENRNENHFVNLVSAPKYGKQTKRFRMEASKLAATKKVPYEYTEARIPIGNDEYLTQLYGDYMALPPVEERGTHHDFIVFYDPDKSYKEYEGSDILDRYFAGDSTLELL